MRDNIQAQYDADLKKFQEANAGKDSGKIAEITKYLEGKISKATGLSEFLKPFEAACSKLNLAIRALEAFLRWAELGLAAGEALHMKLLLPRLLERAEVLAYLNALIEKYEKYDKDQRAIIKKLEASWDPDKCKQCVKGTGLQTGG